MNISIIGSRGIPAKYGGYEVFVEELSKKLVDKGFNILVGCEFEKSKSKGNYQGIGLYYFPIPPPSNYSLRKLYEALNDIYFMISLSNKCDFIYLLGVGTSGVFSFIPKLLNRNAKLFINIDGVEWKREKFSLIERYLLKFNNFLSMFFADKIIIDSKSMRNYLSIFQDKSIFIPYGVEEFDSIKWNQNDLVPLVEKDYKSDSIQCANYWLVVARLEPENNILMIINGFLKSNSSRPLVIVGNFTSEQYKRNITNLSKSNEQKTIIFTDAIYNKILLNMLRQNCFAYIHGHSVGGTNPSLLESMILKNIIVAHDNEFNREVCRNCALYFGNDIELAAKIDDIERDRLKFNSIKNLAYLRAKNEYSWNRILNEYIDLFNSFSIDENF